MKDSIEKKFKRLRNLPQYKDIGNEELMKIAESKVEEAEKDEDSVEIEEMFTNKDEKKAAVLLLRKYLKNYTFDNISEKNTVKQLVFLEVFNSRLQAELNQYHEQQQPSPPKTIESLHSNLTQISLLKAQLGIRKDKEKSNYSDAYLVLENLKKKFKKWGEENQGSRTLICPHCSKMVMLKIKMESWEAQKHPFFIDRFIANIHLMTMYKNGKISIEDVAKVLQTSQDYVTWLLEKVFPKSFKPEERKEEVQISGE